MSATSHTRNTSHVDLVSPCAQAFFSERSGRRLLVIDDGTDVARISFADAHVLANWIKANIPDEEVSK